MGFVLQYKWEQDQIAHMKVRLRSVVVEHNYFFKGLMG
jgi:hypothetical protein